MYILFHLPRGAGGASANYVHWQLTKNLQEWSAQYNIPYRSKVEKLLVKVTFDEDKYYDFFALTWRPKAENLLRYLTNYSFIEPMRRV